MSKTDYKIIQLDDNENNPLRLENILVTKSEFGSDELLDLIKAMKAEAVLHFP